MTALAASLAAPGPGAAAETQNVFFWVLAVVSVTAGVGMILARRAVHCVLLLAVVMLCLAVLYAMAGAPFLAFVQVIVYTGAVLMLFLFVLMLVGVSSADAIVETIRGQRLAAGVAGIAFLVLLALGIGHAAIGPARPLTTNYNAGNLQGIAFLIFHRYVFPFEVTSALLITAALGAMVLAHRERTTPKPTQRELSSAAGRERPPGPAARPRHLRPAQCRGHARPAARRHAVRPVRQPRHRPARPGQAGGPASAAGHQAGARADRGLIP